MSASDQRQTTSNAARSKWDGIVPPLVTPLSGRDTLDTAGFDRLIEHVIGGGVTGVFVLGTTGEGPCLSRRLRRDVVVQATRTVKGRVPVLVGVTDCAMAEAVASMREAAEAGADAVVAAPPFYLPLDQDEVVNYYRALAAQSPLPLFVYNMPALTKVGILPDTVRRLMEIERIAGLKDSSGNKDSVVGLVELARERPGWPVFAGHEHLLIDALRAGAAGGVCAGANVFPRMLVGAYEAVRTGDAAAIEEFQKTAEARRGIYNLLERGTPGTIRTLKAALGLLNICADHMSEPFERLSSDQLERLNARLGELGVNADGAISTS